MVKLKFILMLKRILNQLDNHKEFLENKKVRIAGKDKLAKSVLADHVESSKKYYHAQKGIISK